MSLAATIEPQYAPLLRHEPERLGLMTGHAWATDPKRLVFTAARYKFVAKMLDGRKQVLEVGCADAMFSRIVQQHVENLTAIDFDQTFVDDVNTRMVDEWRFICIKHDMVKAPIWNPRYDAIFTLDVLEHIRPEDEAAFLRNCMISLQHHGVMIVGAPSLESQPIASEQSRAGHVNCKTGPELAATMRRYFHSVFLFGMNDETLHTGHHAMAHYLLAVCADPRNL